MTAAPAERQGSPNLRDLPGLQDTPDVLDALPAHKRELARLLLQAQAPVPSRPAPRAGGGPVPATPAQARLFLQEAADPGAGTGSHAVRLRGPLDPGTLAAALTSVLGRHEALRTRLDGGHGGPGGPVQHVTAEPYLRLQVLDLADAPPGRRAAEVARQVAGSARRPLDLASGESTRFRLLRLGEDDHVLVLAAHLAFFDGWSSAVFLKDLSDAYRGRACAPPALQFPDFAAWQRRWLEGPGGAAELGHWRDALAGLPPARAARGFARGHLPVGLDPAATSAGFALGAAEGATPFMTLLAALAVVLARRQEREEPGRRSRDVVVGTPAAGRVLSGMEDAVGQFTTVVPIRVDCSGRPSFRSLLGRARRAVTDALARQRLPVDALFGEGRGRAGGGVGAGDGAAPPYSVLFALHNYPAVPLDLPGISVEQVPGPPARHLELYSPVPATALACVGLVERDGRVSGTAEYNRFAATAAEVGDLVDGVGRVLSAAVHEPGSAVLT
ncbi:non-ribosomal peptide synthetase [Planomonospora sphaerica]|uniref:Non-ribosomal peptide synthetase n=1 Tax=Planomonospora sphaerica TaxID=161355 RepID=A0A171DNN5_9ACTN|nr:condensation domain-containing protein [Planomonospora sphaerica]GAT70672.1 non-ribosomal peptide synthetase [Planomonospora sphaerica]